ncbi:MAG TPA: DUF2510 domain-containing protein [Thermoleophilaceae bacterium]|jgi:hypothetical protein
MNNPPPNWYPDPRGEAELRYWDGSQWTEHTHSGQAAAAPASPPPAQAPPPQAPAPAGPPAAGTPTAAGGYHQPAYQQGAAAPAGGGSTGGSKLPLIIGGALAAVALVVVLVLVLAGGGGDDGGGEEAKVEDRVKEAITGKEPEGCEDFLTTSFVQKSTGLSGSEGVEACKKTRGQNTVSDAEVKDVKVTGEKATATAIPGSGPLEDEELEISLVKQGDEWKIDDLDRPSVAQGDDAERAIINTVLNFGSSEGVKACDYLSYAGLQRLGGRSGCESSFKEGQPANYSPQDISVTGTTATMVVEERRQNKTIKFTLSREVGTWKIDSFEQQ